MKSYTWLSPSNCLKHLTVSKPGLPQCKRFNKEWVWSCYMDRKHCWGEKILVLCSERRACYSLKKQSLRHCFRKFLLFLKKFLLLWFILTCFWLHIYHCFPVIIFTLCLKPMLIHTGNEFAFTWTICWFASPVHSLAKS